MTATLYDRPSRTALRPGVALVLPAYNEAAKIEEVVEGYRHEFTECELDFTIVVVNDGSTDDTGAAADLLAALYPEVHAIHHPENQGYGAAVSTGLTAAAELGYTWSMVCDSDAQFLYSDAIRLIEHGVAERADLVIGKRIKRADGLFRLLLGWLWTLLNVVTLQMSVKSDIDCAYKLVSTQLLREVLADLGLHGQMACISPELVAKCDALKARVVRLPVRHLAREAGHQTGANPMVMLKSLIGVPKIYWELLRGGYRLRWLQPVLHPRDRPAAYLTLAAMIIAINGFLWFGVWRGQILAYPDAISHLLIARRTVELGVTQLGGVWLPLPQLLDGLFVWSDALFYSGLAGSIVSLVAFVVGARYTYKLAAEYNDSVWCGVAAASIFMLNTNVLYLASTPMTELLLITCAAAAVYFLMRWTRDPVQWRLLSLASIWCFLGTLTRYEGWVLLAGLTFVVGVTTIRARRELGRGAVVGLWIFFLFVAAAGIGLWVGWSAVIFGDWLNWLSGAYAKPSLWTGSGDVAIGSLSLSAATYGIAILDNVGAIAVLLALEGLVVYLIKSTRSRWPAQSMTPLAFLVLLPFFWLAIYAGQRPLHVPQINGDLYNIRFGLMMVLPVAFFAAYLVNLLPADWPRVRAAGAMLVAAIAVGGLMTTAPATLIEGVAFHNTPRQHADEITASWLRTHYDHGLILMAGYGNEAVQFGSHLPVGQTIYEGSNAHAEWRGALADPHRAHIEWIVMRTGPTPDEVATAFLRRDLPEYTQVYTDSNYRVLRSRT